ncbi:MAG TPA: ParB N-terminal domain-containing protein [Pirellulales bacterium]|jgi:hypothetical protein|nr:ParB N-terminal domain-containing protein [Pirellulales bacterium]
MKPMNVVMKKLSEIRPCPHNPRVNEHVVARVAASIKQFGFRQPIVVDATGEIVVGHVRYKAAELLALDEVPVVVADDLTPAQIRAYRIADNKTGELADWDTELLSAEVSELNLAEFDLSLLGFADNELAKLLQAEPDSVVTAAAPALNPSANAPPARARRRRRDLPTSQTPVGAAAKIGQCDPDELPPSPGEDDEQVLAPADAVTRWGDIWVLGEHRLLCGGVAAADLARLLDGAPVHLVHVDAPSDLRDEGLGSNAQLEGLVRFGFAAAAAVLLPGRAFFIWGGPCGPGRIQTVLSAAGLHVSQTLIGTTPRRAPTCRHFQPGYRWCLYGWRAGAEPQFCGPKCASDLWVAANQRGRARDHSQLPVEFVLRAMRYSTRRGENVLDVAGGCGSTLIAAEMAEQRAFVIESDQLECDTIICRWERFTGRTAVREKGTGDREQGTGGRMQKEEGKRGKGEEGTRQTTKDN